MRRTKLRSFCVGARTTHARVLVSLRLYAGKKKKGMARTIRLLPRVETKSSNANRAIFTSAAHAMIRNSYVCGDIMASMTA